MTAPNIIASGLSPQGNAQEKFAVLTNALCGTLALLCQQALTELEAARADAVARLNTYIPTERPLTIPEAAAYLQLQPRTVQAYTSGKHPTIQFTLVGGQKRIRKAWLDTWLDKNSAKPAEVKL